jgi:hypothetical protein
VTIVRPAAPADAHDWLAMRCALWPDGSPADHREEIRRYLSGSAREPQTVLLAERPGETLVGYEDAGLVRCFRKTL